MCNTHFCCLGQDEIRMTTGQAQLLVSRKGRFTQFANLVDDCEFQRGEQKTTCADLQGFFEMVNFQVIVLLYQLKIMVSGAKEWCDLKYSDSFCL